MDYKIFGAVALNAHGLTRLATQDLDLFIAPTAENVARLQRALKSVFADDPSIHEITDADLTGGYPAIQSVPPDGGFSIDVLVRPGDAYMFDPLDAVRTAWQGAPITVVSVRQLYEMKRDTVRWKDKIDAERLRQHIGLEDN